MTEGDETILRHSYAIKKDNIFHNESHRMTLRAMRERTPGKRNNNGARE